MSEPNPELSEFNAALGQLESDKPASVAGALEALLLLAAEPVTEFELAEDSSAKGTPRS